jgi:hypothetical protein
VAIFDDPTAEIARRALRDAGLSCSAEEFEISAREERWAVSLPDRRIAWFPGSEAGRRRLAVERRVLQLLADRCSFRAPVILLASDSGFDLRRMVPAGAIPGATTGAAGWTPDWRNGSAARSARDPGGTAYEDRRGRCCRVAAAARRLAGNNRRAWSIGSCHCRPAAFLDD